MLSFVFYLVLALIVIYLISEQQRESSDETFERRDN
jgi:hypothetical protein